MCLKGVRCQRCRDHLCSKNFSFVEKNGTYKIALAVLPDAKNCSKFGLYKDLENLPSGTRFGVLESSQLKIRISCTDLGLFLRKRKCWTSWIISTASNRFQFLPSDIFFLSESLRCWRSLNKYLFREFVFFLFILLNIILSVDSWPDPRQINKLEITLI